MDSSVKKIFTLEEKFLVIGLSIVIWMSLLVFLAIFGYFSFWPVLLISLLEAGVIIYYLLLSLIKGFRGTLRFNRLDLLIIVIILFFSITTGILHHDLPTGRDDFSYLVAAHELVETGELSFSDLLSRPLHGLRNLGDDIFTSQFLPAYNTYLAVFEMFFGREGLFWSNAILLFFSLLCFYYIGKNLASRKAGVLAVVIAITSFVFNWFPRRTNTENLSLFLFWIAIAFLLYGIKKHDKNFALLGTIPLAFSVLSRIESFVYLFLYLFCLLILFKSVGFNWVVRAKKPIKIFTWVCCISMLVLFAAYNFLYSSKYIANQIRDFFKLEEGGNIVLILAIAFLIVSSVIIYKLAKGYQIKLIEKKLKLLFTVVIGGYLLWVVFIKFQLIQIIISKIAFKTAYTYHVLDAGLILLLLVFSLFVFKRKRLKDALVLLICAPTFIYLAEPFIAYDLPWFLRRFYPFFIPLVIIMSSVFLAEVRWNRRFKTAILSLVIIINVLITLPIFNFIDHQGLFNKIDTFSSRFSSTDDLIIGQKFPYEFSRILSATHYFFDLNSLQSIVEYGSKGNYPLYSPEEIKAMVSQYKNVYIIFINDFEEYPYHFGNCESIESFPLSFIRMKETNTSVTAYLKGRGDASSYFLSGLVNNYNFFPSDSLIKSRNLYICKIKDKNIFSFN